MRLRVVSQSMMPLLRVGDTIVVQRVSPASLRRGDLIVVVQGETFITHRLVAIDRDGWRMKGDRLRFADPPVQANDILGRVVAIERGFDSIDLSGWYWTITHRIWGFLGWLEASFFQALRRMWDNIPHHSGL